MAGPIPRVAVFKPDASVSEEISHLFLRHEYSVRTVTNVDEAAEIEVDEAARFGAAIIPLRLWDGSSGISACLKLRSHSELGSCPILGLSFGKEKSVLQAFYEVGADVVLIAPFDPDLVYLQVTALARQRASFDHMLRRQQESSGISRSVMTAFDTVREALLIFDSEGALSFSNTSAQILLGLSTPPTPSEADRLQQYFQPYLLEHQRMAGSGGATFDDTTTFEGAINRVGGATFPGAMRIATLDSGAAHRIGWAVTLTDLSELAQLSNSLLQAQRTRSLCLLAAACSLNFLEATGSRGSSIIVSPMLRLEEYVEKSERICSLNAVLTTLLEFLDLVINPDVVVKVHVQNELKLAVRAADFFQLLGHMILHAVEYAGQAGETTVDVSDNVPGEGVSIVVTAKSRKVTPFLPNDRLSNLIQGNLTALGASGRPQNKISFGLSAAQEMADKYRTSIEYQTNPGSIMKIRVRLPVSYK